MGTTGTKTERQQNRTREASAGSHSLHRTQDAPRNQTNPGRTQQDKQRRVGEPRTLEPQAVAVSVLLRPPTEAVISTEATDSFTVRRGVERPPHFAFAVACSFV